STNTSRRRWAGPTATCTTSGSGTDHDEVEAQTARAGPLQDRQLRHDVEAEASLPSVGSSLRSREIINSISVRVHGARVTAVPMRTHRIDVQPDLAMVGSGKTPEGDLSDRSGHGDEMPLLPLPDAWR